MSIWCTSASFSAIFRMYLLSFLLPLNGVGARYGASVSKIKCLSSIASIVLSSPEFLKVNTPPIPKLNPPNLITFSASSILPVKQWKTPLNLSSFNFSIISIASVNESRTCIAIGSLYFLANSIWWINAFFWISNFVLSQYKSRPISPTAIYFLFANSCSTWLSSLSILFLFTSQGCNPIIGKQCLGNSLHIFNIPSVYLLEIFGNKILVTPEEMASLIISVLSESNFELYKWLCVSINFMSTKLG